MGRPRPAETPLRREQGRAGSSFRPPSASSARRSDAGSPGAPVPPTATARTRRESRSGVPGSGRFAGHALRSAAAAPDPEGPRGGRACRHRLPRRPAAPRSPVPSPAFRGAARAASPSPTPTTSGPGWPPRTAPPPASAPACHRSTGARHHLIAEPAENAVERVNQFALPTRQCLPLGGDGLKGPDEFLRGFFGHRAVLSGAWPQGIHDGRRGDSSTGSLGAGHFGVLARGAAGPRREWPDRRPRHDNRRRAVVSSSTLLRSGP